MYIYIYIHIYIYIYDTCNRCTEGRKKRRWLAKQCPTIQCADAGLKGLKPDFCSITAFDGTCPQVCMYVCMYVYLCVCVCVCVCVKPDFCVLLLWMALVRRYVLCTCICICSHPHPCNVCVCIDTYTYDTWFNVPLKTYAQHTNTWPSYT